MKYEYAIQQKYNWSKQWITTAHFDSVKQAKEAIKYKDNNMYDGLRIAKRAVGKWEVVK